MKKQITGYFYKCANGHEWIDPDELQLSACMLCEIIDDFTMYEPVGEVVPNGEPLSMEEGMAVIESLNEVRH